MTVTLDGTSLTIDDVVRVSRGCEQVALREDARQKVAKCRDILEEMISSSVIYGINMDLER